MLGSEGDFKIRVQNLGYLLPYKSGVPNHLFSTCFDDFNLMTTLTVYLQNLTKFCDMLEVSQICKRT